MKAAVYHGPDDVRLEEVERPRPGCGDLLVQMLACGICGSDLMNWYLSPRAPMVLGHEPIGLVVETGVADGPPPLAVGTRVFLHHHVPCLVCDLCRRGRHTLCPHFKRTCIRPGGLAEFILSPAENVRIDVLPIPDGLAADEATLIEPLACCIRGLRWARVSPQTRLLVVGGGPIGLLCVQAARARGTNEIAVAEPMEGRRSLAERFGATAVEPVAEAVRVAFDGARPDVVVVCTPVPAARELALCTVDAGGTVQLFAPPPPDQTAAFDLNELFFREITLQSTYSAGPYDTREALRLLASGVVRPAPMITHRFRLSEVALALETARSGEGCKVVVMEDGR